MSILLYGYTTWSLGNCTRMLGVILNKSKKQHPPKQQLYGHSPSISKTIKVRQTRHAGRSWKSKDKLISDVLLWTPSHGRASVSRSIRTYVQQLCVDECPEYDTKQSDGEFPIMLKLWGIRSTSLLLSLPSPLWPRVVALGRILSIDQIELNCVLMLNWIVWNRNVLTVCKQKLYLDWIRLFEI